jgi:hypothetical protein
MILASATLVFAFPRIFSSFQVQRPFAQVQVFVESTTTQMRSTMSPSARFRPVAAQMTPRSKQQKRLLSPFEVLVDAHVIT